MLAVLADRHGQPVPVDTFTVATPSGGLHLYFLAPAGVELRNTAGKIGWKVDTRAHGGYVVAPGSIVDGGRYRVVVDAPAAPLPHGSSTCCARRRSRPLRPGRCRSRGRRGAVPGGRRCALECVKVRRAPKGQRNATLYAAALALGQLVAGGELAAADVTRPSADRGRSTHRGRRVQRTPGPRHHRVRPARRGPAPAGGRMNPTCASRKDRSRSAQWRDGRLSAFWSPVRWVGWVGDGRPWRGWRYGGRHWWACWREHGDTAARWRTDLVHPTRRIALDALLNHSTQEARR